MEPEEKVHHHQHKNVQYTNSSFAVLLSAFCSLAGWFFGYDQGVTGGIVVMSSFKNEFCVGVYANTTVCDLPVAALPSDYRRFLVLFTFMYNVGCFIGAMFISSFVAEKFGRRAIIFTSAVLFLIGTSIVIFPPGGSKKIMILILIERIIEGTGVGCSSFSCPLYASEIAPTNLRGMLFGFMQMTVVTGLFAVNVRIRQTDDVTAELDAIADAIQEEGDHFSITELCTTKKMLERLGVGVAMHILQQTTGINPVFNFGGIIYQSVLGKGIISLLILSGANMLSTIPALFLFDRLGRRKLLIFGGLGMAVGHFLAATVFATGCDVIKTIINGTIVNEETVSCQTSSGIYMLFFTAIFVCFFALSWGPVAWIYAAEIFPLNIRARAVPITTGSN
ncbi:unnamed protein product [Rotaria sp. Silwood1]|nr:unnamed protein product [Rotaria sp. Silwood1]CAF1508639.1 unnamed protein product [Rotaria sp. Silwood1]